MDAQSSSHAATASATDDFRQQFSTSSQALFSQIDRQKEANLLQLLELLYGIHPEYGRSTTVRNNGNYSAETLMAFLRDHEREIFLEAKTSSTWADICRHFLKVPGKQSWYSGRMVLIAALLHEFKGIEAAATVDGKEWLAQCSSFVQALSNELLAQENVNISSLLTEEGTERWAALMADTGSRQASGEADISLYQIPNLTDLPAKEDYLSRKALAAYLAKRLQFIYETELVKGQQGSFFTHIDGAWGSGKSTLMNFLKEKLGAEYNEKNLSCDWITVDFNAWQHQRLNPPWWFLMMAFYRQARKHLWQKRRIGQWFEFMCGEWWWRLNTGTSYLVASFLTLLFFFVSVYIGVYNKEDYKALPAVQVGSFIGFLWSLTKLLRTSLVPGSSRAALNFIEEHGKDPMQVLAIHFEKQVRSLNRPVAIFIDDLDRCNQEYGVQLLEGLQTMFKNAPVVYVIAADRKWLITMYEAQFPAFCNIIAKPGKPFGLVFLDKVFQLSVELPPISMLLKESYWKYLLQMQENTAEEQKQMKEAAVAAVRQAEGNEAKMRLAEAADGQQKQWIKEASVSHLSIRQQAKDVEHHLQQFIDLVEPNPRSMKRLINDISTAKTIAYLYNEKVNQDQLILWTILRIQYPLLAEYFWANPERLPLLHQPEGAFATGDPQLDLLLQEPEVRQLFLYRKGEKLVRLDDNFLYQLKFEKKPASVTTHNSLPVS